MRPETEREARQRHLTVGVWLRALGFRPLGHMMFMKGEVAYDLSAADLDQLERIEREGLFVIPPGDVHDRILALGEGLSEEPEARQ